MNGVSVVSARIAALHTRLLLVHYAWRIVTDLGYLFTTVVLRSNCGQRFFLISASLRWGFDSFLCLLRSQTECLCETIPWKLQLKAIASCSPRCFSDSQQRHQSRQTKQWWRRWGNGPECGFISDRKVTTVPAVMSVKWSFHAGEKHSQYAEKCCVQHGLKVHESHFILCSESGTMK